MKRYTRFVAAIAAVTLLSGMVLAQQRQRRHVPPGGYGPGPGMVGHLTEELGLTEDQRTEIQGIFDRYHAGELGQTLQTMEQSRRQLHDAIHDPTAGEQAVLDAARVVSEQSEQLALERHRMFVEISDVLTEEQREKAQELMQQRGDAAPGFQHRRHGRYRPGG
jgi:Spy/CpxP family protein refolding chaperone